MSFMQGQGLDLSKWVESRINGGMVTAIDAADLPDNVMQLCKNARVRFDRTSRRSGHNQFTPVKPNSQPMLKLATLIDNQGNSYTYRFSPIGVHRLGVGVWTPIVGTALTGTAYDKIRTVVINNRFVFSNNGVGYIQEINAIGDTYARLGNAPKYRYITGFYNRVVGANRTDGGSFNVEVGWSADTTIDEWDGSVDITAGTTPLIESPDDFGDPISGVFGIANVLIVPREHSLWLGTKNPIGSNPFSFYSIAKIGCNAPYSAVPTEHGLVWFDQRTATVWSYEVGGSVESIGRPIDNALVRNIDAPAKIFGSYNPIENEYILCIPVVGSGIVKCWTFNFRSKAWVYDEISNIVSADDVDISSGGVTIDDLVGTIDDLVGTIDELSPAQTVTPTRSYGKLDGNIIIEDPNTYTDAGAVYETEFVSKLFEVPTNDHIIGEVRIEYALDGAVDAELWLQKDGRDFVLVKALTLNQIGSTKLFRYTKQIRCRQFAWKFKVLTGGKLHLNKFEIHAYVSSKSSK